jgi:hypothetical protein
VATLRIRRREFSNQKSDLEKAIIHLTEVVLLPPTQHVGFALFSLAATLLLRFTLFQQPDGVKSSIKYFRFLRINFHSLEPFGIPHTSGDISSNLFHALAHNLELTPDDMVQDLEEMMALIPKFITADVLTYHQRHAIQAFGDVVPETEMFRREDTQQVAMASTRSGMLEMYLSMSAMSSWSHAARTADLRSSTVVGGCRRCRIIFFSSCQTGSMGERSGELGGWYSSGMPWSVSHFFVDLLVWHDACHGSARTPLGTHANGEDSGLEESRKATCT